MSKKVSQSVLQMSSNRLETGFLVWEIVWWWKKKNWSPSFFWIELKPEIPKFFQKSIKSSPNYFLYRKICFWTIWGHLVDRIIELSCSFVFLSKFIGTFKKVSRSMQGSTKKIDHPYCSIVQWLQPNFIVSVFYFIA